MLMEKKKNNSKREYDFSVDNPNGRERFIKAILDEMRICQNKKRNDPVNCFYYYKRWLWMQFPWICLDLYIDYGKLVNVTYGLDGYDYFSSKSEYELMSKLNEALIDAKELKTQTSNCNGTRNKYFLSQTLEIALVYHNESSPVEKKKDSFIESQELGNLESPERISISSLAKTTPWSAQPGKRQVWSLLPMQQCKPMTSEFKTREDVRIKKITQRERRASTISIYSGLSSSPSKLRNSSTGLM